MKILLDTNILIAREDERFVLEELQRVFQIVNESGWELIVHPKSIKELGLDKDDMRREIVLSKVHTYQVLADPPDPARSSIFMEYLLLTDDTKIAVDDHLLFSVFKDAVDFLLTEDKGIHRRSRRVGLEGQILSIDEALRVMEQLSASPSISTPPALRETYCYNLNLEDPFFDDLRKVYNGFDDWFKGISRKHRRCWVNLDKDDHIGALMILKSENEPVDSDPTIPRGPRLKICTLKVTRNGQKIGELLLSIAFDAAIESNLDEIYLTHFRKDDDRLVDLIDEFGFIHTADSPTGEYVYLKKLIPVTKEIGNYSFTEFNNMFFPSFYDGSYVGKFIIPIKPEFHERLFTNVGQRQTTLFEHYGDFIVEGNSILKAYICNSKIKKIHPGHLLLFYRSDDTRAITNIGIVEKVYQHITDGARIARIVGKRTVYSESELNRLASKPTGALVLLFRHLFEFPSPLSYEDMKGMGILSGPPQSISSIDHQDYLKIKSRGRIDERYTIG